MAAGEKELKNLLMKVIEESEKADLKLNIKKIKIMESTHINFITNVMGERLLGERLLMGEKWKQWQILFSWAPKSLQTVMVAMKLRHLLLGRKAMINLDSVLKNQRHHFADKGAFSQSYGFSSSHVRMWDLDHKDGWALKNWCFQTVVLEKTLESPLDCKIKAVNPKGNQSWIFTRKTDAKAEAPIFWPCDAKSWHTGRDPDAGKELKAKEVGNKGWDG